MELSNNITIDKEILLYSIAANSNGFFEPIEDEGLIRMGTKYLPTDEFLIKYLTNGRKMMKKLEIKRLR